MEGAWNNPVWTVRIGKPTPVVQWAIMRRPKSDPACEMLAARINLTPVMGKGRQLDGLWRLGPAARR
jgi:hypothetical protein